MGNLLLALSFFPVFVVVMLIAGVIIVSGTKKETKKILPGSSKDIGKQSKIKKKKRRK